MLILLVVLLWCVRGSDVRADQSDLEPLLQRAVRQYQQAQSTSDRQARTHAFALAEQLFQQAVEQQPVSARSAALYVNLGNAALQSERLGPAILAYRRALELEPGHQQAQQNLAFARSVVPDTFRHTADHGLVETLFFWTAHYQPAQIRGGAAACFLAAAILLAAGIWRKRTLARNLSLVPLLGWVVCLVSLYWTADAHGLPEAVVVAGEATLRSADSENAPPRLSQPLVSGTEVRVLRQRQRWSEIELPGGGRTGWVRRSSVEAVDTMAAPPLVGLP